ncbi:unnamed protein product (plasmid) [Mycetohabitans rhizoxinica HKI 454]|uniref:Uncharacterized protein n=1 Tax=Mycetohabitans rhizoxinica (strain DSM 19002 / CIP 109453 / HKI 454) TaxID=882378 RepID=E5AW12_MYCRK|nr:unnamed protein product [Mycetohabitans rhizoxinica HKI 454]
MPSLTAQGKVLLAVFMKTAKRMRLSPASYRIV